MSGSSCPRCDQPLPGPVPPDSGLHRCSGCTGTWLDGSRLRSTLCGGTALEKAVTEQGRPSGHPCPSCADETLLVVAFAGCELDVCPVCKGSFFDPGELEAARHAMPKRSGLQEAVETAGLVVGEVIVGAICAAIETAGDALG